MKNCNIDDLLKVVSPSLIEGYEKKNNVKLTEANEEYKTISDKNPTAILIKWLKIQGIMGLVALIVAMVIIIHFNQPFLGIAAMVVLCVPFLLYFKFVVGKKLLKISEITARCAPILEEFKETVEGLYPSGRSHQYNEEDTHDELVFCAVQILDAEMKFDVVRVQTERMLHDIMHLGNFIEKWSEKLDETMQNNSKFGIEAKRTELFAEARKHIERMDQMISARQLS
jgi:hypothetical protein